MSYTHYDRLSALDTTFLDIESANVHMHVGAVAIFGGQALRGPDGGLDLERIGALSEPALRRNARFRQRLETIPVFGHRVWVDDPRFRPASHCGDERRP